MNRAVKSYAVLWPGKFIEGLKLNPDQWYLIDEKLTTGAAVWLRTDKGLIQVPCYCVRQYIGESKSGQTFLLIKTVKQNESYTRRLRAVKRRGRSIKK